MQELLGIAPKILHQAVQLAGCAVQIVVKLSVDEQLADCALSGVNFIDDQVNARHGFVQLIGQIVTLEQLAGRSLTRIQVGNDFVQYDDQTRGEEQKGLLEPVYCDGKILRDDNLSNIRNRLIPA